LVEEEVEAREQGHPEDLEEVAQALLMEVDQVVQERQVKEITGQVEGAPLTVVQ
jgi:hypothetical protein